MQIPIVFITDNNYALPTDVAITSLIINKKQETVYKIYVIVTNDVTNENKEKLIASGKENAFVELIEVDANEYEEFRISGRSVPPCALIKLKIQELFPQYDKIIYLDGDILVLGDLYEFYNINILNFYLGAISDIAAHIWHYSHKSLYLKKYYNSGILLLNLMKMRENKFQDIALNIKKINNDFHFIDQDAFNLATQDNVIFCHVKYNVMMYNFRMIFGNDLREFNNHYNTLYNTFDELSDEAVILHLTYMDKPWNYKDAPSFDLWLPYYNKSSFNKDKLLFDYIFKNEHKNNNIEKYELGQRILFNILSPYQYNGWSHPEEWGTWTEHEYTGLLIYLDSNEDLILNLNVYSIFYKEEIEIYINDIFLEKKIFLIGENSIEIPKILYPDNKLMIQFFFKNLMSPKDLGVSKDTRKLGMGVNSFYIIENINKNSEIKERK